MVMGSWSNLTSLFFLISLVLPQLIFPATSQPEFFFSRCTPDKGNYTNSSPFKRNLDSALASISSKSNSSTQVGQCGFYNASSGEDPDRANVKVLCRGGVPLEQCRICVNNSVRRILQTCPSQKEGTGLYDDCQILYSDNSINGEISIPGASLILRNTFTAPDAYGFNEALRVLLDGLRDRAAKGTSVRKSAGGDVKLEAPNTYTIYGLVDCFPDTTFFDCDLCLSRLQSSLPSCCSGSIGARLMATSCQINYEIHPLYESLLSPPPPSPADIPPPSSPPTQGEVVIVVVSTLSVSIIIIIVVLILLRKRKAKQINYETDDMYEPLLSPPSPSQYSPPTI